MQEMWVDPWSRKIPWRRKRQPTPVFLPEKSHGQRSLAGYSPWGHRELDTTERLNNNTHGDNEKMLDSGYIEGGVDKRLDTECEERLDTECEGKRTI